MFNGIRASLEGEALVWYSIVQNSCHNFSDFEHLFLQRYWSERQQSKIRTNLLVGKFDSSKGTSREFYFTSKYSVARYLTPPIPEEELVKYLSRHFDFTIARAVTSQQIRNYQEMTDLLREFDELYSTKGQ
ncbi:hypothetical protein QE152_g29080 [Popillia japonica]|uniref:Retrotransposon gag domain-containing protein n=1 Tax=Popillia japonica TaxID=7064 RepID=A0AAW1JJ46_POPJA